MCHDDEEEKMEEIFISSFFGIIALCAMGLFIIDVHNNFCSDVCENAQYKNIVKTQKFT